MHLPGWMRNTWTRSRPFAVAIVAPLTLTIVSRGIPLPSFVLDDADIILTVAIAVMWGLPPAIVSAVLSVSGESLRQTQVAGPLSLTWPEQLANLVLLIGLAIIVNRLVTRSRMALEAAERAAIRERRVRQERERVVATVAHDLATPLTAVSGTVQFAKRFGLSRDTDQKRVFRRLETAAARATSLVRTLIDVGDVGGVRPECMHAADLRDLVRSAAEMMDHMSERHPVALHLAEHPVPIDADAERLHRVFENLLNNAIKYSPDGGRIDVSVRTDDSLATVVVRDHGIGIPVEARSHIFDQRYRGPAASATTAGHGLGLHIAAGIVREHRGTIEAHPASGGGTAICVRLPLVQTRACTRPVTAVGDAG